MTTTERPEIGQSAVANGIRTNYLEDGKDSDPTVMLVHGSGPGVTSYANWRLVIPALAENFHVVAPDMVGFGYSDRPEGVKYSLDTWADQTVGLMDTLGIEKAHLVGNSFGGGIGLRIATKHPDRVDKLVLMGSMGVDFPITEGLDAVWGYDGTLEGMKQGHGLLRLQRERSPATSSPQVRYEGATQPGFQESFSSMFPAPRQRWVESMTVPEDEIRALTDKVLIVHGREDQVIPLSNSYKLLELIDNADLAVFSHCGHWSMIERTADFNRSSATSSSASRRAWPPAPAARPTHHRVSDRDPQLLRRIYEVMVLTRAVEDRMVAMYRGGDLLGSLYSGHWHEAISVGAASTLRPDDYLAPIHRDLGAHLWRGMEPWQVMASFMGKATSPTGGRDGTLHYGRLDLEHLQPAQPHPGQLPGGHRHGVRREVPRRGPGVPGVLRRRLDLAGRLPRGAHASPAC